jgi:hypothetical protein
VGEPTRPRQGLSREQFRELQRGDQLVDRQGRAWMVRAAAYLDASTGEHRAVLVAGDQVLIERERYADSYTLIEVPA